MNLDKRMSKAARALLERTAAELAELSGVPADTIRSFESGRTMRLSRENEALLIKAFEDLGIAFTPENGGGAGVRFAKPESEQTEGD